MSTKNALTALAILAIAVVLYLFVAPMLRPEATVEEETPTDVAVHVATVSRATLHRYVTAFGNVAPEPQSAERPPANVTIGAPVGGLLVSIDCVEGSRVERGDTLFRLDDRVAEVDLQTARAQLEFAEKTYARQQELIAADGTSQRAFQEAEAARNAARNAVAAAETQLALLQITAPIAGTVVRIDAALGQTIEANTVLAELVALDRLVVSAGVPSAEAAGLTLGMPVEIATAGSSAASAGTTEPSAIPSRLTFIANDVDRRSDTVMVRAVVPPGSTLKPGEFLRIRILAEERADRLVVPEASLVTSADEGEWIVVVEGDQAHRQPVTSGLREGGLVEVTGDGLREGMTIVTEDAYSLPPETRVHIVER
ncbi:MAG: efflux RND transporter periplasmic adaptor subunit [Acidobacteriota bacterium]|jgi:membrane fusion protein (multidrug efflux system)